MGLATKMASSDVYMFDFANWGIHVALKAEMIEAD